MTQVGWVQRLLGLAVAAAIVALGCSSNDSSGAGGSAALDSCVAGSFGGGSACASCLRSNCPSGLDALESGCGDYLDCVCASGAPKRSVSSACAQAETTPSCRSAQMNAGQVVCSACEGACVPTSASSNIGDGGTSADVPSSGNGSAPGSGSGSGGGSSSGDDGSDAGGSNGGSGGGSTCDTNGCTTPECSSDNTCSNGKPYAYCMSSTCSCYDTCYYTVGSQKISCASCSQDDLIACRDQLLEACK